MTGNVENANNMIFRRVLLFDRYFNRLLCVAHINKRQGSSETSWRGSKQVLKLRDAHVTGWPCGVASDQRLRQVGDHKTKPYYTQKDLKWGQGWWLKYSHSSPDDWRRSHWKTYTDTPGRALSGRRGSTLSGLCMHPGQQCLRYQLYWCRSPDSYCQGPSFPSHCRSWYWSQQTYLNTKSHKKWGCSFDSCRWTCDLTHQWRRVWMCRRWSKPTPGRVRCTGRTQAVRRPGAHTPYLFLKKKKKTDHYAIVLVTMTNPLSKRWLGLPSGASACPGLCKHQCYGSNFFLSAFYCVPDFVLTL